MSGGSADLEGTRVLVLEDQIVEHLAVAGRDVEVPPRAAMTVQKRLDLPVQIREVLRVGSDGSSGFLACVFPRGSSRYVKKLLIPRACGTLVAGGACGASSSENAIVS